MVLAVVVVAVPDFSHCTYDCSFSFFICSWCAAVAMKRGWSGRRVKVLVQEGKIYSIFVEVRSVASSCQQDEPGQYSRS